MKPSLRLVLAVFFLIAISYLFMVFNGIQPLLSIVIFDGKNIGAFTDKVTAKVSTATHLLASNATLSLDEEEEDPAAYNISSKVVVTGKLSTRDTSWIEEFLPDWQRATYVVNDTTAPLHTQVNKGHEANAYLTYLIENYDNLPSTIAFIHPHRKAWHTEKPNYDNVQALQTLQIPYVQETGYVNLRCSHSPGCPANVRPFRRKSLNPGRDIAPRFIVAWREIFGPEYPIPELIGAVCCAQFAVSRRQVLAHPKEVYERALNWLVQSKDEDRITGRVMEFTWHVLFGKEAVHCPSMADCQCKVYGRCGSESESESGKQKQKQKQNNKEIVAPPSPPSPPPPPSKQIPEMKAKEQKQGD